MTLSKIIRSKIAEEERNITFVKKKGEEKKTTYKELLLRSSKILGYLQSKGIKYKDEIVFQIKDNEDFINVFWGGILGGMIPVPLSNGNNDEHKLKFFKVWNRLNNPYLVCDKDQYESILTYAKINGIDTSEIKNKMIDIRDVYNFQKEGDIYESQPNDIAFIQFSSGSTGDPKGVVLKHSNLLANIEGMITNCQMNENDRLISWLPLSHDMGIIGCHLLPIVLNIDQVNINTNDFMRKPTIWLEKASLHKSTLLFSPNFGLRFTLKYHNRSKLKDIDLSNARLIINGAEPISVDLCEEFLTEMSLYNLKRSTMHPSYGLAEACLGVATPDPSEESVVTVNVDRRNLNINDKVLYVTDSDSNYSATFVDVGYPIKHTSVRVVNLDREKLDDNTVGLIEIKGINVTSGYYNMPEKTKEVLNEEGWLNTGDIGFMRNDRLVIIGRHKDVLFVNGQNFYAHDVERIVREVAGIELNEAEVAVGAARNFEEQTEEVLVFIRYKKKLEDFFEVEGNIKREMNLRLGIQVNYVIPVKQIPKTTSGKVQRFNLIQKYEAGTYTSLIKEISELRKSINKQADQEIEELEKNILDLCNQHLIEKEVGLYDNFFELGIGSIELNQLAAVLQEAYGERIKVTDLFTNPTVKDLAKYIKFGSKINNKTENTAKNTRNVNGNEEMAIVGISLKIGSTSNLNEYWDIIYEGLEDVRDFPLNRQNDISAYLKKNGLNKEDIKYHKASYLQEIDTFDYNFFKILPVEAISMSPAQRLFLETAYKAVEDAGYTRTNLKGTKTGVFVGYIGDMDGYKYQQIVQSSQDTTTPTGSLSTNIAGRVSYILDLKGPNLMIDAACTSSMVALDLACNEIRKGSCNQAIVGGIRIKTIPIDDGLKAGFESSDYRTRPFDSEGKGTGEGEGVIAVMIKPLTSAINDNDHIYGVIKGSAVNHDGVSMGMATPNPVAQSEVIKEALNRAQIDPSTVSYIEAQGTGTKIGDSIEIQGLTDAFRQYTDDSQYCSIGSVRANIGHLFEISGLSSLVKCCLMMKYKKIPGLVNFVEAKKELNFAQSPFYVTKEAIDWNSSNGIRRCGINNFGFSGTNCHVILEEFISNNQNQLDSNEKVPNIFTLSAKSKASLERLVESYISHFERHEDLYIEDVCYTSNIGREHYGVRLAIIANSIEELLLKLKKFKNSTKIEEKIFYGLHRRINESNQSKKIGDLKDKDIEMLSVSANNLLKEINVTNRDNYLSRVAQIYVRGANPAWTYFYKGKPIRKVSLPTYEFERLRCWPTVEEKEILYV